MREIQDPNKRVVLYIKFAQQRLYILKDTLSKQKPGRSLFIHDTLEDMTRLFEAIDTVSDDAIRRKVDLEKGLAAVVDGEKPILDELNKVIEAQPKDYARYKFTIEQAVETLAGFGSNSPARISSRGVPSLPRAIRRTRRNAGRDRRGDRRQSGLQSRSPEETAESKADDPTKPEKKAPTLYRKGEADKDKDNDKDCH